MRHFKLHVKPGGHFLNNLRFYHWSIT